MTAIIYEPKGRAREYAPLAANLYKGCPHRCRYCYVPRFRRISPEQFHGDIGPRPRVLEGLEKDAPQYCEDPRPVHLSFTCDAYQPIEAEHKLTRRALEILGRNRVKCQVLTKGAALARRDFDLMEEYDVGFGVTLVFSREKARQAWEPRASTIRERCEALKEAKGRGIATWVSVEPVVYPGQALEVIRRMHPWVDHFAVGPLNYMPEVASRVNWPQFLCQALEVLEPTSSDYSIKDDLWKHADDATRARWPRQRHTEGGA